MRLLTASKLLFSTPPPLNVATPRELPRFISLRRYRAEDRHACLSLYAESDEARAMLRLRSEFEEFLDSPDYLRLVLTDGLQVVAMGGVGVAPSFRWDLAWLVYGIEAPWHRGVGLDTVLLLARICALPRPAEPIKLVLSSVPGNPPSHEDYGFQHQGRMPTLKGTVPLDCGAAMLDGAAWKRCADQLTALGLGLNGASARAIDV